MEIRKGKPWSGGYGATSSKYPVMVDGKIRWFTKRSGRLGKYVYVNREFRLIASHSSGEHYELGERVTNP